MRSKQLLAIGVTFGLLLLGIVWSTTRAGRSDVPASPPAQNVSSAGGGEASHKPAPAAQQTHASPRDAAPKGAPAAAAATTVPDQRKPVAIEAIPGVVAPGTDTEPPGIALSPEAVPPAAAAYLAGLDALSTAAWQPAIDAFSAAIAADSGDTPAYYQARGVAHTLAEKFQPAIADLRRANQLDPADTESRIWWAAAVGMTGGQLQSMNIYPQSARNTYVSFIGQLRFDYGGYPWQIQSDARNAQMGQTDHSLEHQQVLARAAAKQQAARERFSAAAHWYVTRVKAVPALTSLVFQHAKQRFQRQQFAAARGDLEAIKANSRQDMALLYYHARCLLATGDLLGGWKELTEVVTRFTSFGLAYAARAEASAGMGDARRARSDLALAISLRPADAQSFAARVDAALSKLATGAPTEKPDALRAALEQAARTTVGLDELAARAAAVVRASRARSLEKDEVYQQRLKTLEDAVHGRPGLAAPLLALSEFLASEAQARYERHAPSGQFRIQRLEVPRDPEGEFARAERLADEALEIDPRSARAMVAKARVAFRFSRFGDAAELLRQALAIDRNVPDGLELEARVLTVGASQAEARAADLQTPQTSTTFAPYSIIYWTRYPTGAELQAAEEFRVLARQRLQEARHVFEEATTLRPTSATGWYDLGIWRLAQNDLPGAQQALEKAVQLDAGMLRGHQALAKVYAELGLADKALQEQSLSTGEVEGSVGDMLALARNNMARTALKTAEQNLVLASAADPIDARVPAYQGILREAQQQPDQALAAFRLAAALEEARLVPRQMTGTEKSASPCNPDEVALLMQLRVRLAALCAAQGHPTDALAACQRNLGLEGRMPVGSDLQQLPTAILPVVNLQPEGRPAPQNPTSLLAWSHYEAGVALQALQRNDEATAQYRVAHMAGQALPPIAGYEPVLQPRFLAGLALAKMLHAQGDVSGALAILNKVRGPRYQDAEVVEELRRSMSRQH